MPGDATDVAVLRVVIRVGFSMELVELLLESLKKAVAQLKQYPPLSPPASSGFSHT